MVPRPALFLLAAAVLGVSGCGSKATVSLSAMVQNAEIGLEQGTLGTRITGGFELFLEVGSEASGGSTVSLESFALVRASDQSTLLSPLSAAPQGAQFPLDVSKGQQRIVVFTIAEDKPLAQADVDAICAEPVQIVGAVRDTLSGGETTPVTSIALAPAGC